MLLLHLLVQLQLGAQVLPELSSLALVRLLDLLEASLGLLVLLLQQLNGVHACPPKVVLNSPFSALPSRSSKTAANLRARIPLEIRRLAPSSGVDERAARPLSYKRSVEVGLKYASRARSPRTAPPPGASAGGSPPGGSA